MTDSGWTVETLKAHVDAILAERDVRTTQQFDAQEKAVRAALEAAQKAVDKAEEAATKRFESVNEFRAQLADQAASFLTRREAIAVFSTMVAVLGVVATIAIAVLK